MFACVREMKKPAKIVVGLTTMMAIHAYATIRGLWLERCEMSDHTEDSSYPEFLLVLFRALLPLSSEMQSPEQIVAFVQVRLLSFFCAFAHTHTHTGQPHL
jgi:hypothetical protein